MTASPGGVQISKAFVGKRGASLKMYHRLQQQLRGWCGKVTVTRATAVEGGVLRTRWASWEMKRTSETTRGCVLAGPRPEAGEEAALALVLSSCLALWKQPPKPTDKPPSWQQSDRARQLRRRETALVVAV